MLSLRQSKMFLYSSVLSLLLAMQVAKSDDIEVFFGETKKTNMMFVLDASGSMRVVDDGSSDIRLGPTYWQQSSTEARNNAKTRLPENDERSKFATLQVWAYDEDDSDDDGSSGSYEWIDHVGYYTQSDLPLDGWNINQVQQGKYYRWVYKKSRITQLKEALYRFLTVDAKDDNLIGMMTYTSNRTPYTQLIGQVRALKDVYSGKSHREHLVATVLDLDPYSGTPTANSYYQATEYFAGNFTQSGVKYASPIDDRACGYTNSIVLLTDGKPTTFRSSTHTDMKAVVGSCDDDDSGKECTIKLSSHYFSNPVKAGTADSTIQTSTIAFALDDTSAKNFLRDTASTVDGEKLFYTPSNASELANAFKASLESAQDNSSFVAPSVPLSQSNRLRHGQHVYMGMFKPLNTTNWHGNFKKYYLKEGVITQKDEASPAVDSADGSFYDTASSYWSNGDGNQVTQGGALPLIGFGSSVKVLTNLNSNNLNRIDSDFVNQYVQSNNQAHFETLFAESGISDNTVKNYFSWITERTTKDANDASIRRFGDPLHSRPQILQYDDDTSTAFVATNQGYLHAIDTETGRERWAFFPRQLLKKVQYWSKNSNLSPTVARQYGLDGQISIHSFKNSSGVTKHYLYVGMRRGGNYVYAMDISSVDNPKMLFTVGNEFDLSRNDLGYSTEKRRLIKNLGQTWAKPVVAKMHFVNGQGYEKRLILAGGYDTYYDDLDKDVNPATGTIDGDAIYDIAFDGTGGDQLYRTTGLGAIKNSIAADLTLIDLDNDGILDNLYAADVGGKIYRVDYKKNNSSSAVKLFADVSSDSDGSNRFYNKADVSFATYNGENIAVVAIGSGYRPNPLNETTVDKFYAFFDLNVANPSTSFSTLTKNSLVNVSSPDPVKGFPTIADIRSGSNPKSGWYIKLPKGEKILSSASTLNFVNFFTTFTPIDNVNSCAASVGSNKLYGVDLLTGTPAVNQFVAGELNNHNDRYSEVQYSGIAPGVTLLFPDDTSIAALVGTQTICSGDECDFLPSGVKTVKWKKTE